MHTAETPYQDLYRLDRDTMLEIRNFPECRSWLPEELVKAIRDEVIED